MLLRRAVPELPDVLAAVSLLRPVWPPCRCHFREFPEWRPDCGQRWCHVRWWVGMGGPSLALIVGGFVAAGTVFADDSEPCDPRPAVPAHADMVVCTPDAAPQRGVPVTIDELGRVVPDAR